jgi:hypothetical protein
MSIDDLTIRELREVRDWLNGNANHCKTNHGKNIVILDRGFVYVGDVSTDMEWVYIANAKNIRVWGTTKGLGELIDGPLANTKLDDSGNIKASRKALIALIAVQESKWNLKP